MTPENSPEINSDITGLARHLVKLGDMTETQARSAIFSSRHHQNSFVKHCIEGKLVDQGRLATAISTIFDLPLMDLSSYRPLQDPGELATCQLIEKHKILPLAFRSNRLVLAVSDPTQTAAIREFEFHSGRTADLVIAPHNQVHATIHNLPGQLRVTNPSGDSEKHPASHQESSRGQDGNRRRKIYRKDHRENLPTSFRDSFLQNGTGIGRQGDDANDAPVIRAVNRLLLEAVSLKASDIHIEPYEKTFRVRIRIDGVLRELATPPIHLAGRLISRLKIMAQLDISERRLPQDGRIKLPRSGQQAVDFRISTLPTLWGEKTVLRIMDPQRARLDLDQLGLNPQQQIHVVEALARPQGMILVTGPTGSGKTVTLYSVLARLNDCTRNISTAEDPVELNLSGINQVQVKPAIGLSFITALRAFLRQDPDVIMVGEIRDQETAQIAIKAAQTGHLVLSTLHTNSAPETLNRLLNMGIEPYNVASSVTLIIAQRLARKLCHHCKEPAPDVRRHLARQYPDESLTDQGEIYQARGCDRCHGGYQGRVGIYEVVPISKPMTRTIIAGGNSMDIAAQARKAGYLSLRQSALARMTEGLTSLDEVNRIT